MVAALKTIEEIENRNGIEYMWAQGTKLVKGLEKLISEYKVEAQMIAYLLYQCLSLYMMTQT